MALVAGVWRPQDLPARDCQCCDDGTDCDSHSPKACTHLVPEALECKSVRVKAFVEYLAGAAAGALKELTSEAARACRIPPAPKAPIQASGSCER
eukprot:8004170-Pyramimonas_sp.AAC.1